MSAAVGGAGVGSPRSGTSAKLPTAPATSGELAVIGSRPQSSQQSRQRLDGINRRCQVSVGLVIGFDVRDGLLGTGEIHPVDARGVGGFDNTGEFGGVSAIDAADHSDVAGPGLR